MFTPETIHHIPHAPGIYMYHNHAGDIIYVGKAVDLNKRVHQYFQSSRNLSPKTRTLVSHIDWIETIVVDSEMEALILECNLIKANRPKYNIMLKDDKSYPYIKVTLQEAYPRILMTRKHIKDGGKYFGPFTSSSAVKQTIEAIGKVYPLRRCRRKVRFGEKCGRPCLNYHIGQCSAPCTGKVKPEIYLADVDAVIEILNGRDKDLTTRLENEMREASIKMDYERAAIKRDQIQGIAHIVERQKIISSSEQDQDIIAMAEEKNLVCVQVFNVRGGKMIGRDHAFMDGVEEAESSETMTAFIKQYYIGRPYTPPEIVLGTPLMKEEEGTITEWLGHNRGSKVTFTLPKKGHKAKLIEMVKENAALTLKQRLLENQHKQEKKKSRLDGLKDLLAMEDAPHRIEAYDISNISGSDNVGGMVVFEEGKAARKAYRRFKIKNVDGQNDYGSMQEMLFRRIERGMKEKEAGLPIEKSSFLPFPDVMCIDGGKTHVDAVRSILCMYPELQISVTGLVKDDHHKLRGLIYKDEEYPLSPGTPLCTFLNEISEEVHRYALGYHQQLRSKGMMASELENIPGIGEKRRVAIMRHFGRMEHLLEATPEEIMEIDGLDRPSAEALMAFVQEKKKEREKKMNEAKESKPVCVVKTKKFCKDLNLDLIYASGETFDLYDTGINRPGLQLYGFYEYFDYRRIQIIGKVEIAYLMNLTEEDREAHIREFMSHEIPCVIVCWDQPEYHIFEKAAKAFNRTLMVSKDMTTTMTYRLVDYVDRISAPKTGIHGVLVEVHGVGVVITGDSGIGKSETALELIKRGNTFIADDVVDITCRHGNTLIGEAPEMLQYFMEVRGIGIIDVRMLYGARSVKRSVEIDMVIHLENWSEQYAYDRLGLDDEMITILGVDVPKVVIPVSGGRNIASIIEAAAINNRMKAAGYHSAQVFCDRFDEFSKKEENR